MSTSETDQQDQEHQRHEAWTVQAWWLRLSRPARIAAGASAGVVVVAGAVTSVVLALSPGTISVSGTLDDQSAVLGETGCNEQAGSQVMITGPSGQVLDIGSLRENKWIERKLDKSSAVQKLAGTANELNGISGGGSPAVPLVSFYNFTAHVPGGLGHYAITVQGLSGKVWFTEAQMAKGPGLSCG